MSDILVASGGTGIAPAASDELAAAAPHAVEALTAGADAVAPMEPKLNAGADAAAPNAGGAVVLSSLLVP